LRFTILVMLVFVLLHLLERDGRGLHEGKATKTIAEDCTAVDMTFF
jgi:hypothetical protein